MRLLVTTLLVLLISLLQLDSTKSVSVLRMAKATHHDRAVSIQGDSSVPGDWRGGARGMEIGGSESVILMGGFALTGLWTGWANPRVLRYIYNHDVLNGNISASSISQLEGDAVVTIIDSMHF